MDDPRVEAVARALYKTIYPAPWMPSWDRLIPYDRAPFYRYAQAAIAALDGMAPREKPAEEGAFW